MDLPHYIYGVRYFSYFGQSDTTTNDASKLALAKYSVAINILLVTKGAKFCTGSTRNSYPSFARLFAESPTRIIFWNKRYHTYMDKGDNS
tara:strand:- start:702 stop:971 length:270 start_codon:yes stop_codon:yes gene_type:complete